MTIAGGLRVEFPDGRPPVELRFEVHENDVHILRGFAADASQLFQSISRMGDVRFALEVMVDNVTGTINAKVAEPSDDQRAVLLHRLRPLILTKEPWSFDRTCGALSRATNHPFMRERLRIIRDVYSGKNLREQVVVSKGGLVLNSDVAFDRWLNGFEYHRDVAGRAELQAADDVLSFEATRSVILDLLLEKVNAIQLLYRLTATILSRAPV